MRNKEWIAMVLAGGRGTRLGVLTKAVAKPAVPFGGQYRIIDFTLSNCKNSGIDTVGILTQYQPLTLHAYIGNGAGWDLDCKGEGGVHMLPPYAGTTGGEWYAGTADAVYKNREFIEHFEAPYVIVLSGDHIYKMDYSVMLEQHKLRQADVTVGVLEVPWREASRFGIMETTAGGRITDFVEKPYHPKGNLASMGVYIFTWKTLKQYLMKDAALVSSSHDFGKNIIPSMLAAGQRMYAYHFNGYWKDVGTLASYWEANMDLLGDSPKVELDDAAWPVYSPQRSLPPHYHGAMARVSSSLIAGGVTILGEVENSVIFPGAYIGDGVKVKNSVIMSCVKMEQNAAVDGAIVIPNTIITPRINSEENSGIIQVVRSKTQEAAVQVSLAV